MLLRYFERVLGVKTIAQPQSAIAQPQSAGMAAAQAAAGDPPANQLAAAPFIGLVDFAGVSRSPSLEDMALRLRDAVAGEWQKLYGATNGTSNGMPANGKPVDVRWVEPTETDGVQLLIAFGATAEIAHHGVVVLAPSLKEMAGSPALKRAGWNAVQAALRKFPQTNF